MLRMTLIMLIDTHSHLNFSAYKDDADEVIKRSLKAGVFMINVGSQYSTSVRAVEYAEKYETGIWAAVGIHPIHLQKRSVSYSDPNELEAEDEIEIKTAGENFDYVAYKKLAENKKVVAIGEVGLDYHHFEEGNDIEKLKTKQKEIFLEFVKLANEVGKPLIIHCWDAYDDLYEILKNNPAERKGVIHSFVGSWKTAKKFIELGYKIGLNGIITYGISYDKLIREIDLQDIVLETDCPYLSPMPKKSERNEPIYVKYVAEKIAQIKNISIDEVSGVTTENAEGLFGL